MTEEADWNLRLHLENLDLWPSIDVTDECYNDALNALSHLSDSDFLTIFGVETLLTVRVGNIRFIEAIPVAA